MLTLLYCCVQAKWNGSLGWYGALSTHYFYLTFSSVHYTGIYTGKVAVVAMLFPIRVSTSCGSLYIYYIYVSYVLIVLHLTDQRAVRGLSADLSVIYGSTCPAVLIL